MKVRWTAVKTSDPGPLLERLGLVETEAAVFGQQEWTCVVLPTGWVVVTHASYDDRWNPA